MSEFGLVSRVRDVNKHASERLTESTPSVETTFPSKVLSSVEVGPSSCCDDGAAVGAVSRPSPQQPSAAASSLMDVVSSLEHPAFVSYDLGSSASSLPSSLAAGGVSAPTAPPLSDRAALSDDLVTSGAQVGYKLSSLELYEVSAEQLFGGLRSDLPRDDLEFNLGQWLYVKSRGIPSVEHVRTAARISGLPAPQFDTLRYSDLVYMESTPVALFKCSNKSGVFSCNPISPTYKQLSDMIAERFVLVFIRPGQRYLRRVVDATTAYVVVSQLVSTDMIAEGRLLVFFGAGGLPGGIELCDVCGCRFVDHFTEGFGCEAIDDPSSSLPQIWERLGIDKLIMKACRSIYDQQLGAVFDSLIPHAVKKAEILAAKKSKSKRDDEEDSDPAFDAFLDVLMSRAPMFIERFKTLLIPTLSDDLQAGTVMSASVVVSADGVLMLHCPIRAVVTSELDDRMTSLSLRRVASWMSDEPVRQIDIASWLLKTVREMYEMHVGARMECGFAARVRAAAVAADQWSETGSVVSRVSAKSFGSVPSLHSSIGSSGAAAALAPPMRTKRPGARAQSPIDIGPMPTARPTEPQRWTVLTATVKDGNRGKYFNWKLNVKKGTYKLNFGAVSGDARVTATARDIDRRCAEALVDVLLATYGFQRRGDSWYVNENIEVTVCDDPQGPKLPEGTVSSWVRGDDVFVSERIPDDATPVRNANPFRWVFSTNYHSELASTGTKTMSMEEVMRTLRSSRSAWYSSSSSGRAYVYVLTSTGELSFCGYRTGESFEGMPHVGLSRPLVGLLGGMDAQIIPVPDALAAVVPGGGVDIVDAAVGLARGVQAAARVAEAVSDIATRVGGAASSAYRSVFGGSEQPRQRVTQVGRNRWRVDRVADAADDAVADDAAGGAGGPGGGGGGYVAAGIAGMGEQRVDNLPMFDAVRTITYPSQKSYSVIPTSSKSFRTAYQTTPFGVPAKDVHADLESFVEELVALREAVLRHASTGVPILANDLPMADDQYLPYISTPANSFSWHSLKHYETRLDDTGIANTMNSVYHGTCNVYHSNTVADGANLQMQTIEDPVIRTSGSGTFCGYRKSDKAVQMLEKLKQQKRSGDYGGDLMRMVGTNFSNSIGNFWYNMASTIGMVQPLEATTYTAFMQCLRHHLFVAMCVHRPTFAPGWRVTVNPAEAGFFAMGPNASDDPLPFVVNTYYVSGSLMNMLLNPTQRTPLQAPFDASWTALRANIMSGAATVVKLPSYVTMWHTVAAYVSAIAERVNVVYKGQLVRSFESSYSVPNVGVLNSATFIPFSIRSGSTWTSGSVVATVVFCSGGDDSTLGTAQDGGPLIELPGVGAVFAAGTMNTDPTVPATINPVTSASLTTAFDFVRYGRAAAGTVMSRQQDIASAVSIGNYLEAWNEMYAAFVPAQEYIDALRVVSDMRYRCTPVMRSTVVAGATGGVGRSAETITGGSQMGCSWRDNATQTSAGWSVGLTSIPVYFQARNFASEGPLQDNAAFVSCYGVPIGGDLPTATLSAAPRAWAGQENRTTINCKREMAMFQWVCAATEWCEPVLSALHADVCYSSATGFATRLYKHERLGALLCASLCKLYPVPPSGYFAKFDGRYRSIVTPIVATQTCVGLLNDAALGALAAGVASSDPSVATSESYMQARMMVGDNSALGAGPMSSLGDMATSNSYVVMWGCSQLNGMRTIIVHTPAFLVAGDVTPFSLNAIAPVLPVFGDDYNLVVLQGQADVSTTLAAVNRDQTTSNGLDAVLAQMYPAAGDFLTSRVSSEANDIDYIDHASAWSRYLWGTLYRGLTPFNPAGRALGWSQWTRTMNITDVFRVRQVMRAGSSVVNIKAPSLSLVEGVVPTNIRWYDDWVAASGAVLTFDTVEVKMRCFWAYTQSLDNWFTAGVTFYINAATSAANLSAMPASELTYINTNKGTKQTFIVNAAMPALAAMIPRAPRISRVVPGVSARTEAAARFANSTTTAVTAGFRLPSGESAKDHE